MLHTMVSAAEDIPVEKFVASLLLSAEKYFLLKQKHPQMKYLNIGGGVPPLSENYDHRGFLEKMLTAIKARAEALQLDPPTIVFENGSLVAATPVITSSRYTSGNPTASTPTASACCGRS